MQNVLRQHGFRFFAEMTPALAFFAEVATAGGAGMVLFAAAWLCGTLFA
ncbi:hypothetical protein [uncultured Mailhella sp.]|nr:hypothetical protein [uncultured Mailhella sp.]